MASISTSVSQVKYMNNCWYIHNVICPQSVEGSLTNFAENIKSESVFPVTEPAWYSYIQSSVPVCHSSITKYWQEYKNENKSPHYLLSPLTTTNFEPL